MIVTIAKNWCEWAGKNKSVLSLPLHRLLPEKNVYDFPEASNFPTKFGCSRSRNAEDMWESMSRDGHNWRNTSTNSTETAGKAGKTVASGGQINHFYFYNIFGRFEHFYPKFELSKPTRVLASPEISMYCKGVYLLRTAAKCRNMVFVVMFLTIIDIIVWRG